MSKKLEKRWLVARAGCSPCAPGQKLNIATDKYHWDSSTCVSKGMSDIVLCCEPDSRAVDVDNCCTHENVSCTRDDA